MKRVYISVDIEGCATVCNWKETMNGGFGYEEARRIMTEEVNACTKALFESGVEDVIIRDAHDNAMNLIVKNLDKRILIIREWSGGLCDMMDGVDQSIDACIMIGYHSPTRSSKNPLSHTLNLGHNGIVINGEIVSEYYLNSRFALNYGVPTILVTGDKNLCDIVTKDNKYITTVDTKDGIGGAVISKHPELVNEEIYNKTLLACKNFNKENFLPKKVDLYEMSVTFKKHPDAYKASFYPNAVMDQEFNDVIHYKSTKFLDLLTFIKFTL